MKRFSLIALLIAGFVSGIAFVYSCGGGSSSSYAATSGVVTVGPMQFVSHVDALRLYTTPSAGMRLIPISGVFSTFAVAPVDIHFACTITGMEAKIYDEDIGARALVELHAPDTTVQASIESLWADSSSTAAVLSTVVSVQYDPVVDEPKYLSILFEYGSIPADVGLHWVKLHYTIP